jgi:hypothetical protein
VSSSVNRPASNKLIAALLAIAFAVVVIGAIVFFASGRGEPLVTRPPAARSDKAAPPAPPRFFSPTSFWNARLPDDAAVDPDSPRLVKQFVAEIDRQKTQRIGPWIETTRYSTPVYVVGRRQAEVPVELDTGPWGKSLEAAFASGVPIPKRARPAAGTDGHMTVYQPSTDRLWEFWRAVKKPDGWHASWGGAMTDVSSNPGYYTDAAWPGAGHNWGSTGTSLPVVGGTMLIRELRSGRIEHALAIAVPDVRRDMFAWPAQRADGAGGAHLLPEGARLRLDPTLDLATLGLSPPARAIAEAAQRYGLVIRDRTNHATGFYAEDPAPTAGDPYNEPGGVFQGRSPGEILEGFPWDRLQVLQMHLCRRAPCERGDSP